MSGRIGVNMQAERIVKIKKIGIKKSMDIEVNNKSHTFYGNGIATSNSHAVAYASVSYWSMYARNHFPLHFYAAYLAHAKSKQDSKQEVKEVIEQARKDNIRIDPPHISSLHNNPYGDVVIENNKILFGLIDIKGIGLKHIQQIHDNINSLEKTLGNIKKWRWLDFMCNIKSNSKVLNNLILVGATPGGEPRKQKALEYSIFQKFTVRDLNWVVDNVKNHESLEDLLSKYVTLDKKDGGPPNEKRRELFKENIKKLNNSPYSVKDHPDWIVANERELIGIPLTYNPLDNKSVQTDMTCQDFINGKRGKINLLVEISTFRPTTIKNGPNKGLSMGILELKDSTNSITALLFSDDYKNNQEFLFDGNVVLVKGFRSKKDENTLIIKEMMQL